MGNVAFACVGGQNAYLGERLYRWHQSFVDGKGTDCSGNIAAGSTPVDERPMHINLPKVERHITVGFCARPDNCRFTQR